MKRVRSTLSILMWLAAIVPALYTGLADSKPSPTSLGWPDSIASTGDSITRGFNTGTIPFTDAPANSWSTGTNASVNSHYSRIVIAHPAISGHSYNDAVTGAQMVDLNSQVAAVNGQHVDYVTILLGANDVCTDTEAQMTPVATFRSQFQTALSALAASSPDSRILVLSIPNIYNLWSILHTNGSAVSTWNLLGICQSMLANPQSNAQADIDRRNRVNQRVIDFNTQLAEVCEADIHCRFDNNAVFNTLFIPADVSTRDYFHPSLTGQAKIADASYTVTFDFTDSSPPISWAEPYMPLSSQLHLSPNNAPLTLALKAQDNIEVAGIEYQIDGGPIIRYADTAVTLNPGSTLTFRAVDINGNNEAWHSIFPSERPVGK